MITDWVAYITPLPAVQQQILTDAGNARNPGHHQAADGPRGQPAGLPPGSSTKNPYTYAPLTPEQIRAYTDAYRRFIT